MSRICVKGLPAYVGEDRVRTLLGGVGAITDVKIARTKDGKSRQFAFVGFRGEGDAAAAVAKFNRAFMDTARLTVETAVPIASDHVLTARSRHTQAKYAAAAAAAAPPPAPAAAAAAGGAGGSGGAKRASAQERHASAAYDRLAETLKKSVKDASRLEEYMALVRPANRGGVWENDDTTTRQGARGGKAALSKGADGAADSEKEEEEEEEEEGDEEEGAAKAAAPLSDADFLRSKVNKDLGRDGDHAAAPAAAAAAAADTAADSSAARGSSTEADVGETGRLFVRNLPYTATEDDLRSYFVKWGRLADVRLPKDATGRVKGYAYVALLITGVCCIIARVTQPRIPRPPLQVCAVHAAAECGGGAG